MIKISKLPNDITICSDYFGFVETVSIAVCVNSGGLLETSNNYGISHFLEHMAFKGTATYTAQELARQFDNIGGYFNAYTAKEKTVYYAKVLKENLERAIELLADILQNSIFDVNELEKERNVIQQELAQAEDTPDDIVFDYFYSQAFLEQPMGASLLGSKEFIQSVGREEIVQFMDKHYTAQNVYVASAGNVQHAEVVDMVHKYFAKYALAGKKNIVPNTKYTAGFFHKNHDLEQTHFVMGFQGVSYFSELFYVQHVAAMICGGGMSSRLFQEVREKLGLAYVINASGSSYHDIGLFSIYCATEHKFVEQVVEITMQELYKLTSTITVSELECAKKQLKSSLVMSMESTASRAEKLSSNIAHLGRYVAISEIQEKIAKITIADIEKFFAKIILQSSPTFASIGKRDTLKVYNSIKSQLG